MRFSFLFALLLFTHPLGTLAQEKKKCRLCDPPDPPAKAATDEKNLLGDRLIIGVPVNWNRFDATWSKFIGTSVTYLFNRHFGLESTVEFTDKTSPPEEQETRIEMRISMSGIWFLDGSPPDLGVSPYGKMGFIHQGMVRYESRWESYKDCSVPLALQVGAGLMIRFKVVSLGVEAMAISPGFSVDNELVEGSLNLRVFVGFHVDNPLWALWLLLGFI